MKLLFICNQNVHRSKTAEMLFKDRFETRSAGIYRNLVTEEELNWADLIFVMEDHQRKEIANRFPQLYLKKQILCLDIEDIYRLNDSKLVKELNQKISNLTIPQVV